MFQAHELHKGRDNYHFLSYLLSITIRHFTYICKMARYTLQIYQSLMPNWLLLTTLFSLFNQFCINHAKATVLVFSTSFTSFSYTKITVFSFKPDFWFQSINNPTNQLINFYTCMLLVNFINISWFIRLSPFISIQGPTHLWANVDIDINIVNVIFTQQYLK